MTREQRERYNAHRREYYQQNKEKEKQYQRDYNAEHREKVNTRHNNWQRKNRDKVSEYMRRYNEKLREKRIQELVGMIENA